MGHWIWRILLTVAVLAALTVGASAAEVTVDGVKYDTATGTVLGPDNQASIRTAKILSEVNGVKITKIADEAFQGCGNLRTVEITEGLTTIGKSAFNRCTGLERVYFSKDSAIITIGESAFEDCAKLNNVILPEQLSAIQGGTFAGCTGLASIYIPSKVTEIPADAFFLDTKLTVLHYGSVNVTALDQKADDKREVHYGRMSAPEVTDEATCTTEGKERVTVGCESCKRTVITEEHAIPRLPHTPENVDAAAATCKKPGNEAGVRCSVCGTTISGLKETALDPANHENIVGMEDMEPTCTEAGSTGGKMCTACGVETEAPTPVKALGHLYDYVNGPVETVEVEAAACTTDGLEAVYGVCTRDGCGAVQTCDTCEKLKEEADKDPAKKTDYIDHVITTTEHRHNVIPAKGHTPGEEKYVVTTPPTCTDEGLEEWKVVCSVCGEALDDGAAPPDGEDERVLPPTGHTPKQMAIDKDKSKAATCLEDGITVYKETECTVCHIKFTPDPVVITSVGEHKFEDVEEEIIKEATCTETGLKKTGAKVCTVCGEKVPPAEEVIPMTAHTWANPQPDEDLKDQDKAATCGEDGVSHVIVTCSVCGRVEHQTITIPATGVHAYGDWTVTKQPTATQDGEESRTCSICGKVDTRAISPTGPVDPDDPDDPDNPSKPEDSTYKINLVQASYGTSSANKSTAKQGETVTVTYTADSGYVLDMIRVIGGSSLVPYTDLGGGRFRFTMPASDVEVRVTFDRADADYGSGWAGGFGNDGSGGRSDPRRTTDVVPVQSEGHSVPKADAFDQVFQDVPTGHWAAGEINWASEMGYMSGANGRFNPDGLISHQQMWMVLARLTGANPANMAEARNWAVRGGYADGSAPTGAVKRHQLVTALYRCARLTGSVSRNNTSLAGYTDSGAVPIRARDAFSWALTSGVVSGDADGRLNPNKVLTRAEFAVILYCYSQRY